ncbi:MAG: DNA-binding protein [Candidatus Omnitrophica bacterium]|nr:DNA-binding protein [Candidatus Omnitrophota bacterium]
MKKVYSLQFTVYSLFMVLYTVHCALFTVCLAESISSTELLNSTNQYNNKIVIYEGEVIGDVMMRGSHAWLNLWDGTNTIGIWATKEMARDIQYVGRYGSKGDKITVRGIFHKACPEHGGDLDVHAEEIIAHVYGGKVSHPVDSGKIKTSVILCGVLVIVSAWWFVRKRI